MRVALIGPVPPALGGATPGGVATHQVYLAAGLAAAGVDAPLLATNLRRGRVDPQRQRRIDPHPPDPPLPVSGRGGSQSVPISGRGGSESFRISGREASGREGSQPFRVSGTEGSGWEGSEPFQVSGTEGSGWDGSQPFQVSGREGTQSFPISEKYLIAEEVGFPMYGMGGWTGWTRVVPYALYLARTRIPGSRREVLRNLLGYRGFLTGVRPEVIHVQHPLERCLYVRMVQQLEGWRVPLVVTAHSLFGEHSEETIYGLMAPNLRAADRVIAVSDHIAEQAIELGVARERVKVIRSGVDVERFHPRDRHDARRRLGIHHDIPVVLFVGNLEPRKQVDVLLRAMQRVQESLPEATSVVIGSGRSAGAEDQTDRLISLSRELHLDRSVNFVGSVDDQQLLDYYAAANVFALPSSSEAQGIVALEAMACGLPVVASAVGGLLGTIHDGHTGFLVASGAVAQLAERLLEVLQDSHRAETLGAAARQSVERDFSWPRTIDATVRVYREALACH